MEKGPSAKPEESDSGGEDDDEEEEDDQELYEEFRNAGASATRSVRKLYGNGIGSGGGSNSGGGNGGGDGGAGGFRIRIPTGVSIAQPGLKNYPKAEQKLNPNSNPASGMNAAGVNFGTRVVRESNPARPVTGKRGERERERDPVAEMVSAIKALGDGFVRMERMKMEMAREIEAMRMEMEIKRTDMILESQQRIVEAFAKAVTENKKKAKRIPSPEA